MAEPKRGNPQWQSGVSGNPNGRPRTLDKEKRTNKELRNEALLSLVRRLRPYQSKAIQAAVTILENKESNESNKLRASAMILTLYKDLLKDLYHKDYDMDEGEEMQENNGVVFSLKVVNEEEKA